MMAEGLLWRLKHEVEVLELRVETELDEERKVARMREQELTREVMGLKERVRVLGNRNRNLARKLRGLTEAKR